MSLLFGPLMEILRDRLIVLACDLREHGGSAGFDPGYDIVTAGMDAAALVERPRVTGRIERQEPGMTDSQQTPGA
jgi:hypothetical protein